MSKTIFFVSLSIMFVLDSFGQTELKELLSYPYPNNLTASSENGMIAWTFNQEGKRNIFISKDGGDSYEQITTYNEDDGQAISNLAFSTDGKYLIYMSGGEPGGNWSRSKSVNPSSSTSGAKVELLSLNIKEKETKVLAEAPYSSSPSISPKDDEVAFIKKGKVWTVPIDGSEKAKKMFEGRGKYSFLEWSSDGNKLAFVSKRDDHSFIGVYTKGEHEIKWIDPSFSRDTHPKWSPEGDALVYVRRPAAGGPPDSILGQTVNPWEIRVAKIKDESSTKIWEAPKTLRGSVPTTHGKYNLHWAANNRIIFLSTQDNWPHLYSIPVSGGDPLLLTPGQYMIEYVQLSPDKKKLVFSANTGPDTLDIDRRHIGLVSVDKKDMKILTPGEGLEVSPVFYDENDIAFISSSAYRPALPVTLSKDYSEIKLIGESLLSSKYSSDHLVKPKQVVFESADGMPIHGILFEKDDGLKNKPAVLSIHGGPMRQMTLGWNHSDYYASNYAVNQWLAEQGFVVLWVNYRKGIGYGDDFHHPPKSGKKGASEYQDILAAGRWLAKKTDVSKGKVGVYGGSYGGYLTALALGKNSDVFSAGVDIHGVHSRMPSNSYTVKAEPAPDAPLADTVIWKSSPIAHVEYWTSPVLLIHGDDDRNVSFKHSTNLINRLEQKGVEYETLVIPDDTHHWMKHDNLIRVYKATTEFLKRNLLDK